MKLNHTIILHTTNFQNREDIPLVTHDDGRTGTMKYYSVDDKSELLLAVTEYNPPPGKQTIEFRRLDPEGSGDLLFATVAVEERRITFDDKDEPISQWLQRASDENLKWYDPIFPRPHLPRLLTRDRRRQELGQHEFRVAESGLCLELVSYR